MLEMWERETLAWVCNMCKTAELTSVDGNVLTFKSVKEKDPGNGAGVVLVDELVRVARLRVGKE